MSCFKVSTKQKILCAIDDIDLICKHLFDSLASVTPEEEFGTKALLSLLTEKDKELQSALCEAKEQEKIEMTIKALQHEISQRDQEINAYQMKLKESEKILSTAIFYARQKLESAQAAHENPIDAEELVRFGHRISASHGVMAPQNWIPGDPRRPYPTDNEMRRGFLGHLDDSGIFMNSITDAVCASMQNHNSKPVRSGVSRTACASANQSPVGATCSQNSGVTSAPNSNQRDQEEVEVMSTDSSSSSSSED